MRDSDATLVFCSGPPTGGTALTAKAAADLDKPCLIIDLGIKSPKQAAHLVLTWLYAWQPEILNIAGPRASEAPELGEKVQAVLQLCLQSKHDAGVRWPPGIVTPDLPFQET